MPVVVDNEEYFTVPEACEYLGGISPQTLRLRARANGVKAYKQGLARAVYYRKSDLERMRAFRPVDGEQDSK